MAGVEHGGQALQAVVAAGEDDVVHQQDAVLGGDAHEHDEPDHAGHAQRRVRDEECQERAGDRQHQRTQDGGRLHEVFEEQHEHDVDAQHAGEHGQAKAGEELRHRLGVADFRLRHARRQALQTG